MEQKRGEFHELNPVHKLKLKESNIAIVLNTYDDMFSSFDPRPYKERALSDDFLLECKKAAIYKGEEIELRFLVPKKIRSDATEFMIIKRLKDHFFKHFNEKQHEISLMKQKGFLWILAGFFMMVFGTFLSTFQNVSFYKNLLLIITEPAGWFFFWEGLGKIFIHAKERSQDYHFYRKMLHAEIVFSDY